MHLLPFSEFGGYIGGEYIFSLHAQRVASKAVGAELGMAKMAQTWCGGALVGDVDPATTERTSALRQLDMLVQVLESIADSRSGETSVVSMAWGGELSNRETMSSNKWTFLEAYETRVCRCPHMACRATPRPELNNEIQ